MILVLFVFLLQFTIFFPFLFFFFFKKIMCIIIHQVVLCGCRIQMAWQMEPGRLVKMSQTHPSLKHSIGNLNKTKDLKFYGLQRVVSCKVHVQTHGWLWFLEGNFLYCYVAICALFNGLTLKKTCQILMTRKFNSDFPLLSCFFCTSLVEAGLGNEGNSSCRSRSVLFLEMGKYFIFHMAKLNQSHYFINMFFCRGKFFSDINKNNNLIRSFTK